MTARLRTPDELISSLPLLLGFMPRDSVVVVGLTDAGVMAPLARVDRADCLRPDVAQDLAASIAAAFCAADAHQALIVGFHAGGVGSGCVASGILRDVLATHLEVLEAWEVSRGRYRAIDCENPDCCPRTGRPVPPPPTAVARAMEERAMRNVGGGGRTGRKRRPRAPQRRMADVMHSREACWRERGDDLASWRRSRLDEWRECLAMVAAARVPADATVGALSAGLRDVVVRDAIVVDMVPGQATLANLLCRDPGANGVRQALSAIIGAENPVAPDRRDLAALVRLADRVVWLDSDEGVPALTLAGLALWWAGDSVAASQAIDTALVLDPRYRLAELVACALEAHMPPGWLAVA